MAMIKMQTIIRKMSNRLRESVRFKIWLLQFPKKKI